MVDPSTHNRPFADKRDKLGMDAVPNQTHRMTLDDSIPYSICTSTLGNQKPTSLRILKEIIQIDPYDVHYS